MYVKSEQKNPANWALKWVRVFKRKHEMVSAQLQCCLKTKKSHMTQQRSVKSSIKMNFWVWSVLQFFSPVENILWLVFICASFLHKLICLKTRINISIGPRFTCIGWWPPAVAAAAWRALLRIAPPSLWPAAGSELWDAPSLACDSPPAAAAFPWPRPSASATPW